MELSAVGKLKSDIKRTTIIYMSFFYQMMEKTFAIDINNKKKERKDNCYSVFSFW